MIKTFFKWSSILFIGILLMSVLAYGAFRLWEHSTGEPFVTYLKANSETIPIGESFTFQLMNEDIAKSDLILVGEIHGFHVPTTFDVDFFQYLHQQHGVRHYIAELDYVQATMLNQYMMNGDQELLKTLLKRWVVVQGRNNLDYLNKYIRLQQFYQSLPEQDRFEFIGIDRIQDLDLMFEYLKTYSSTPDRINSEDYTISTLLDELMQTMTDSDSLVVLTHLRKTIQLMIEKTGREDILFQNFQDLYRIHQLEEQKLYGFFGLYHVFQYRINGDEPLAAKIRSSDLGLDGKILSINFMMNDSYMVMPSNQLPSFMQDEGRYTKMPLSADVMLFMYVVGVNDFKRMTPPNHMSLMNLNAPDSPYSNSIRLNTSIQLLPVAESYTMDDEGMPYVQYTVFVRNSDWAEPLP